MESNPS